MCSGCRRNTRRLPEKLLQERILAKEQKEAIVKFKQAVYLQLHEDLSKRPIQLRGITDALELGPIMGVDKEEFIAFHKLAVKASKQGELSKLFDFVDKDGRTFVAILDHTARYQTYLNEEDDPKEKTCLVATKSCCIKDIQRYVGSSETSNYGSVSN